MAKIEVGTDVLLPSYLGGAARRGSSSPPYPCPSTSSTDHRTRSPSPGQPGRGQQDRGPARGTRAAQPAGGRSDPAPAVGVQRDPARPAAQARVGPFRVRVEDLRLPANVAAGMNALRLCALAYRLRATTDEPEGPIEVTREADGTWRIHDGRHRYIAAVIAGRPDVLCVERP
jgi:hypothetical protein